MDIHAVKEGIVGGAKSTYHAVKDFVIWGGHKVQAGYTNYLVPTVKALWSFASNALRSVLQFVRTTHGTAFAIATGLFVVGLTAFKIAQHTAYDEDLVARAAWRALGITAFIGATVATGFGIAAVTTV